MFKPILAREKKITPLEIAYSRGGFTSELIDKGVRGACACVCSCVCAFDCVCVSVCL